MGKDDKKPIRNSTAEFLVFTDQAGEESIEARCEDETVWLSQKMMTTLFEVDVRTVSEYLQKIFSTGEVESNSVIRKFRITATDGKQYSTNHYQLGCYYFGGLSRELQAGDAVSAVGDAGVAGVCNQGICTGSEADGEWFVSRERQK